MQNNETDNQQAPLAQHSKDEIKEEFEILSACQLRVLGCLLEKELTTPDQYPLTANSLLLACNQKTSRTPVMNMTQGEVVRELRFLETLGWVNTEHGSRAEKYSQRFTKVFNITRHKQALIAVLTLQGPQSQSELITKTKRMVEFADDEEFELHNNRLMERKPPLVSNIGKLPNQRDCRFCHLLAGEPDIELLNQQAKGKTSSSPSKDTLLNRIDILEKRVSELESLVVTLNKEK